MRPFPVTGSAHAAMTTTDNNSGCHGRTKFIEAAVSQLLPAKPQVLHQVHTLEACWTLVALAVWGTVGVRDGQAVPGHIPAEEN